MIYSGIGSRQTPQNILNQIVLIAEHLAKNDWVLRSGAAPGADSYFELGCDKANGKKEIYLPWRDFNGSKSSLFEAPSKEAYNIAESIHPNWSACSYGAKKLHARNIYQILGKDLKTPSALVVCWTKEGRELGGTRTALILAKQYKIKIINLAVEEFDFTTY